MTPAEDKLDRGAPGDDKAALRAAIRETRRSIPQPERDAAASAIARAIASVPELAGAGVVLAYCANAEEIDPAPAVEELRARGARIAYPRVTGPGTLDLHEVGDVCELAPGAFSLDEPAAHHPAVDPRDVDAVLVPGVVFDLRGHRVGYGGGFYDRLLADLAPECVRIGLAFDSQVVGRLPEEEHDIAVDVLVTPTRLVRTGTRHTA